MHKASSILMQNPGPIPITNNFTIIGFVQDIARSVKFTRLYIKPDSQLQVTPSEDIIEVYFTGKRKEFVDVSISRLMLVYVVGAIVVSSRSTPSNQILVLEGKNIAIYKNVAMFYDEPSPKYVSPSDLTDSENLAF